MLHAVGFGVFTLAGAILFVSGLARQKWAVSDLWRLTSSGPPAGPAAAGAPAAPAVPLSRPAARPAAAPVRGGGVRG